MNVITVFTEPGKGVIDYPSLEQDLPAIQNMAAGKGFKCYVIDAGPIANKEDLLEVIDQVCEMPEYFGLNWDALHECLRDYSFAPANGYIFAMLHAQQLRAALGWDYQTLIDIFADSASEWEKDKVIFRLLLG